MTFAHTPVETVNPRALSPGALRAEATVLAGAKFVAPRVLAHSSQYVPAGNSVLTVAVLRQIRLVVPGGVPGTGTGELRSLK